MKELLNVSQVEIGTVDPQDKLYYLRNSNHVDAHSHVDGESTVTHTVKLLIDSADGAKCTRCWNYRTDIGVDPRWPTVCGRCAGALDEIGFPPLTEEVPV
jgi:isoleucyl-tRNA synthetase